LKDEKQANEIEALSKDAAPVSSGERIHVIDVLRGFALFGVLAFNMFFFSGARFELAAWPEALDRAIYLLTRLFIEAKFYSLFSLLFGWGMAVQMSRAEKRGAKAASLLVRRLLVLLLFGTIHALLIWSGDILMLYAQMGLLLLLFRKRSNRTLLVASGLALLLAIVMRIPGGAMDAFREGYANLTRFLHIGTLGPAVISTGSYAEITRYRLQEVLSGEANLLYYIGNIFAMFLLGLYVGKRRILHDVAKHQRLILSVMFGGLVLGLTFNTAFVLVIAGSSWIPQAYSDLLRVGFRTIGAPSLMLFYVSAIVLLFQRPAWRKRLAPLANLGRMAFTNYITQSIVATLIFYNYGLGLFGRTDPTFALIVTIMIYFTQIRFSAWWLERYQYGPLEWLWRTLTYGRRPPFRIGESEADVKPLRWLEAIRRWWKRTDHRRFLRFTWMGIAVWGLLLILWYVRLQGNIQPITLSGSVPDEVVGAVPGDESTTTNDQTPVVEIDTPVISPVAYEPGAIAASGDLMALAETFDVEEALAQIENLTGPSLLGRLAGSPEGRAAGDYIAERFAEYGLQPAGDEGAYFQDFPVPYIVLSGIPTLSAHDSQGALIASYEIYQDFTPLVRDYAGAGEGSGDVAWANECQHDDFDGLDVVGDVVVCYYMSIGEQTRQALEHGAAALLLMIDPQERSLDFAIPLRDAWLDEPLPTFWVSPEVVGDLLLGSGRSLDTLPMDNTPGSLVSTVSFAVEVGREEMCPPVGCLGRNVLGVLPGRDPLFADELLIIGGHYDHMGQGPDGTAWLGANDDASGVAVLLEIARSWHEQGYVPRRSVLFAAWDAEEKGLLGAYHYVDNPRFPLENTLGMIQLDMVGIGTETLEIIGGGMTEEFTAAAEAYAIDFVLSDTGGSDHVPFLQAGVPAVALSWAANENTRTTYHSTNDIPAAIEMENLELVGKITELAMLGMVDAEVALRNLIQQRQAALVDDDIDAFLATSSSDQREADEDWFEDYQGLSPSGIEISIDDITLAGRSASADVRFRLIFDIEGEDIEPPSVPLIGSMRASFEHDGGWRFAGPDLAWVHPDPGQAGVEGASSTFAVAYPADEEFEALAFGEQAAEEYAEIAGLLGLPEAPQASLILLPNAQTLRVSTALSLPDGKVIWIGPGSVKLVFSSRIMVSDNLRSALARLVLAEAGVNEAAAPWLWRGLSMAVSAEGDRFQSYSTYQPRLQQALEQEEEIQPDVAAWAAIEYLRDQLGWSGLGSLISDIGQSCANRCDDTGGADAALLQALNMDVEAFEAAWQTEWSTELGRLQSEFDELLATRQEAVLGGDREAFLSTVDPSIPNLFAEQERWFDGLADIQIDQLNITGMPLALMENGQVLAEVWLEYNLTQAEAGSSQGRPKLTVVLTPGPQGLLWSGIWTEEIRGEHVHVLFPREEQETAEIILQQAEEIYHDLEGRFGLSLPEEVVIKFYDTPLDFRYSIMLSFPAGGHLSGWAEAGASLKMLDWNQVESDSLHPTLTRLMIRHFLADWGVTSEWLLKGLNVYLASEIDDGAAGRQAAQQLQQLYNDARGQELIRLNEVRPDHEMTADELELANGFSWDTVRYLIDVYGEEAMEEMLAEHRSGTELDQALETATGSSVAQFESDWVQSLALGHASTEWIEIASQFDADEAMDHVAALASTELAGRQAGTPGAVAAAGYIAEQFANYGLMPAGDELLPVELEADEGDEEEQVSQNSRSFLQQFPLDFTMLLQDPQLEMVDNQGRIIATFVYHQDFVIVPEVIGSGGEAQGELIWVRDGTYEDMSLEGAIVVREAFNPLEDEVARAVEHGASGLIIVGTTSWQRALAKTAIPIEPLLDAPIPVLELTDEGFDKLLEMTGQTTHNLRTSPPGLSLDMQANMQVLITPPQTVDTANVLGLLPGSDPELAHEVLIIGAHYDHVGDDPGEVTCLDDPDVGLEGQGDVTCMAGGGLHYPGENDNASGVAVLLEIARLWQEMDYRPRRSVLFAAWGAQEVGQKGSSFYVQNPAFPLASTLAVLQMDAVGGGSGYYLEANFDWELEAELIFTMTRAEEAVEGRLARTTSVGTGDHVPFREAGVPTLPLAWRGSVEHNMPQGFDDEVEAYRMGITGRMVALTIMTLAR